MNTLFTLLRLGRRNLSRNPVRNLTVGIMVFLACFMFFFSSALSWNSSNGWRTFLGSTFIGDSEISSFSGNDKDYSLPCMNIPENRITRQLVEYVQATGAEVSPRIKIGAAIFDYERQTFERKASPTLIGTDIGRDLTLLKNLVVAEGRWDSAHQDGVLVWCELARMLNWSVGQEINLFIKDIDGNFLPYTFVIDGILDKKSGATLEGQTTIAMFPFIFISRDYLASLIGLEADEFTELAVWNAEESKMRSIAAVENLTYFSAVEGFEIINGIVQFIEFAGYLLAVFVLIILAISTVNLNLMSFLDRRKEIGTFLSLGFKPRFLNALLLSEMVFLIAITYSLSLVVFGALCLAFASGIDFGPLSIVFAGRPFVPVLVVPVAVLAGGVVTIAILASCLYPLQLTTKMNPIEVFHESEA